MDFEFEVKIINKKLTIIKDNTVINKIHIENIRRFRISNSDNSVIIDKVNNINTSSVNILVKNKDIAEKLISVIRETLKEYRNLLKMGITIIEFKLNKEGQI